MVIQKSIRSVIEGTSQDGQVVKKTEGKNLVERTYIASVLSQDEIKVADYFQSLNNQDPSPGIQ